MKIASALAAAVVAGGLSGCATVYGPALYKIDVDDACTPALATRKCAPSHGRPYVILDESVKTIPIVSGEPKVMDYLGRVVALGDSSGRPGITCGSTATAAFTAASIVQTTDDGEGGDIRMQVENEYFQTRKISASAKMDLISALKAVPNVPANIDDILAADLDVAFEQLETVSVKAVGEFRQYQISYDELNLLNVGIFSDVPEPRRAALAACRNQVFAPDGVAKARMYQALTGFYVESLKAESTKVSEISANLAAKVKAQAADANLADIQAALNAKSTEAIKKSVDPMFVVVAVSFWDPVYIPG